MREETRRKLDSLRAGERRTRFMLIAAGAAAVAAVGAMVAQPPGAKTEIEAVVLTARIDHEWDTGKRYMAIESRLKNGKTVLAYSDQMLAPRPGAHIILIEQASWIGFHSYTWDGRTIEQPTP
jgi:hypothetical protein